MAEEVDGAKQSEKPKGILKHTRSCDDQRTEVHWDEMNILQTYHPSGKEYGHMKINEPPTPYSYQNDESDTEEHVQLDPEQLAKKIENVPSEGHVTPDEDQDRSDEELTEEEQENRKEFLEKRKHHYNEYEKVKLARELIEKELAELEDDEPTPQISHETCNEVTGLYGWCQPMRKAISQFHLLAESQSVMTSGQCK